MGDGPPLPLNPPSGQRDDVADLLASNFPHSSSSSSQLEENGLLQGAQNWCTTKSRLMRFSATWTIHNFSLHFERGVSLESGVFTSGDSNDDSRWCLKLHMSRPSGGSSSSSYTGAASSEADPNAASDHNYNIPNVAPRNPVVVQQLPPNIPPDFHQQHHHHQLQIHHYPPPPQDQQQPQQQQQPQPPEPGPAHPPPPPPPPPPHQPHEPPSPSHHHHHHHHNYHNSRGDLSSSSQSAADESISLSLCLLSTDKPDVWVKYKFCILDENFEECIAARPQSRRFTPGKRCGPTLRSMDTSRRGRFLSEILHDDQLTVSCQIVVVMETQNRIGVVNRLKIPDCSMADDFSALLESPKFSDVTLCVEGKELSLHRNILAARSPVFRAMFEHNMRENFQGVVHVPDFSVDVVQDLVQFVYSGVAPNLEKHPLELFSIADKYGLTRLKLQCEAHLLTMTSVSNVCEILIIADLHQSDNLKKEAMQFLVNNAKEVMSTGDYHTMETTHPRLVSEAFRLMAKIHGDRSGGQTSPGAKRVRLSD